MGVLGLKTLNPPLGGKVFQTHENPKGGLRPPTGFSNPISLALMYPLKGTSRLVIRGSYNGGFNYTL